MATPLLTPLRYLRESLDELLPADSTASDPDWQPDAISAYCPRCGACMHTTGVTLHGCAFCASEKLPWHRITRLGLYQPPMSLWICQAKFSKQWRRATWLGEQLAEQLPSPFDPARVVVCPVPMYWSRRWWRGYNQADLMAQAIAKAHGWPIAPLLQRTRRTLPQTSIAVSQRPANVRGAFEMQPVDLTGYEVILVDDVKTTGSTAGLCAKLLTKAGAKSVQLAVAAVADVRGSGFRAS